jgi:hypothetical protein
MRILKSYLFLISLVAIGLFLQTCQDDKSNKNDKTTGHATIRVYKNQVLIREFEQTLGLVGTLDGTDLTAEFSSLDNKHILSLTINDYSSGTFGVKNEYEPNAAHLNYYSDDLPKGILDQGWFIFPEGELILDQATDKYCEGSFEAYGQHSVDGENYRMEGEFRMPVGKI